MENEPRSAPESTGKRAPEARHRMPWYKRLWTRSRDSHWELHEIERFDRASETPGALFAGRKWYGG